MFFFAVVIRFKKRKKDPCRKSRNGINVIVHYYFRGEEFFLSSEEIPSGLVEGKQALPFAKESELFTYFSFPSLD